MGERPLILRGSTIAFGFALPYVSLGGAGCGCAKRPERMADVGPRSAALGLESV